jgi:hypothetical protein
MARLIVKVNEELMGRVVAYSERVWPGQDTRVIARFVRDAIRRYVRYCSGESVRRTRQRAYRDSEKPC